MNNADFQLRGVGDERLAIHATSSRPAWLWSPDGTRVLWANPVGARLFGARNAAALFASPFGPTDHHCRQIAQLADRLPIDGTPRLERLRGFGATLGGLMTCACSRLAFADGGSGILVIAAEPTGGRGMPLVERLQNLVEGIDTPIAAFARDGLFVGASAAARTLLGFRNLSDAGLDRARDHALKDGRVEAPIGLGHMVLQRVGSGADIGLVALIAPAAARPASGEDHGETGTHTTTAVSPVTTAEPHHGQPDPTALADVINADTAHGSAPPVAPRTTPLRFVWQIDADQQFSIGTDEFLRLIGPRTAAAMERTWPEIAEDTGLDPEGRVAKALATRQTWSGLTLHWPVDGGRRLPVEMAGLPLFDRGGHFTGYRGFGVCRDLDGLTRLAQQRRHDVRHDPPPRALSADIVEPRPVGEPPVGERPAGDGTDHVISSSSEPIPDTTPSPTLPDSIVQTPENVVHFRSGETRSPVLTPVENSAFNELARQLSARLEAETGLIATTGESRSAPPHEPVAASETAAERHDAAPGPQAAWLTTPPAPPRGETVRDKLLLDLMPVGVLIYRLDRLLFANPAFLARMNYPSLAALEDVGGLDSLYVEPDVAATSSTSDGGTPVKISAGDKSAPQTPVEARLFAIAWDNEPAHALIFSPTPTSPAAAPVAMALPVAVTAPEQPLAETPVPAGHIDAEVAGQIDAEDLAAILDTTAEGVIMFDAEGNIHSCNRSAEALFGYSGEMLTQRNVTNLFATESRRIVQDYIDSIREARATSLLDHGREALGQVRAGGLVPLSMTMGRTRADGPNFFAVFRDLSQVKKTETELLNARRQADRAATAKAEVLARISHEVRTPLNAIIGFSEVMIDQRFGPLGNERYGEYIKDIRTSGERVVAIVNDLLDLSRIESGKLDLVFTTQNLNEMVEQCVAVMQPRANRGRIIIRTSLAHLLPTVVADARALRQITLNLIGNSIHLANAGGQVIVSTALSDFGEVMLRVRDTGHGLNDTDLAAAMEPFRNPATSDLSVESPGVSLSLTKALVEANHARFQIKTAPSSGTLIEVVFSNAVVKV